MRAKQSSKLLSGKFNVYWKNINDGKKNRQDNSRKTPFGDYENPVFINDAKTNHIAGSLKKVDSIAIFVCTGGKELSNWSKELFQKEDAVKAYVADIAASLLVEKAMDLIQNKLEKVVLEDQKRITNRYSPGYCGWNVEEQQLLFSLLPEKYCGVSLNEAALMNPIKSVSGIIGIGRDVKKAAYQCNKCEKTDCLLNNKQ